MGCGPGVRTRMRRRAGAHPDRAVGDGGIRKNRSMWDTSARCVIRVTAGCPGRTIMVIGRLIVAYRSLRKQYTDGSDKNPSLCAADDRPALGNHAHYGVRASGCDNDSRRTGVLSPHGRAVRKLHDARQSLLLQGAGTDEYCSSPGAGCRTGSSAHHCCGAAGRFPRDIARDNGALPSFVSSCPTSRTISRF